jgi:hypothetical protein
MLPEERPLVLLVGDPEAGANVTGRKTGGEAERP